MSRFIWEPPVKLRLGSPESRPRTARDLLRRLDVVDAPLATQREAVYGWLAGHVPDALMQTSLRRTGLPAAPLDVTTPAGAGVSIMPGTTTVVALRGWEPLSFVFPRAKRSPSLGSFVVTATASSIWREREPPKEMVIPVRRDGVEVA
jgi:hypothetical protein